MIGFDGYNPPAFLKKHKVAGVILFSKNIKNPIQLKKLTSALKAIQPDILIAVDQEGGKVQRLKSKDGFIATPSAKEIIHPQADYARMAKMLKENGINLNLAPVVDFAVNPNNPVITKLKRSYGTSAKKVYSKSKIFIDAMNHEGILTALKHFPGHGSSQTDSHKGFTDVSKTWTQKELLGFSKHIDAGYKGCIMSAHIFNAQLDTRYPATLSYKINHTLLRDKMGFKGVLISDDLQMKAISDNYKFKKALQLSINSGVNILLIGNYLAKPVLLDKVILNIKELVESGKIDKKLLELSIKRIQELKKI